MRKNFVGYYRPSEEEFKELWNNCLFVLDANVLLDLYRYPQSARGDLLKVLEQVSDRIWIPHQAALEYQENRLSVIAEQVKKFDDVRKILAESIKGLKGKLNGLQLKRRHPAIDPDGFLNKVEGEFSKFETVLQKLEKEQPDVFSEDILRNQIDDLLNGRVGEPLAEAELEKIYQEGKTRYEQRRPPGYRDLSKGKPAGEKRLFYFCNGTVIKREYGDLILWSQIIKEAKTKSIKHLVFITDDEKEDWWWIVESKGKKTIGPRPELINEIVHKADVTLFYAYNSERFLKYAEQYLGIEIKQESITQVQEITLFKSLETKVRLFLSSPIKVSTDQIMYSLEDVHRELGVREAVESILEDLIEKGEIESPEPGWFIRSELRMVRWNIYKDTDGVWRWRRIAPNGSIVGASTEDFPNRQYCVDNARRNGYTGS